MAEPAKRVKSGKKPVSRPAAALALDSLIHERVRLGIVSALAGHEKVSFVDLRDALGITDGNLSAHARKLENAGYLECHKTFVERTPRTEFSLTTKGKSELKNYLDHLESIIQSARAD